MICSKQILGDNVLFDRLNSCHPNIKLNTELNPSKFLDTTLLTSMVLINSKFISKTQNYLQHGPPKFQNVINQKQSMMTKGISSNFDRNPIK